MCGDCANAGRRGGGAADAATHLGRFMLTLSCLDTLWQSFLDRQYIMPHCPLNSPVTISRMSSISCTNKEGLYQQLTRRQQCAWHRNTTSARAGNAVTFLSPFFGRTS